MILEELEGAICTLLGNLKVCPRGRPMPQVGVVPLREVCGKDNLFFRRTT